MKEERDDFNQRYNQRLDYFAAHAPVPDPAWIGRQVVEDQQRSRPKRTPLEVHADYAWEWARLMVQRG